VFESSNVRTLIRFELSNRGNACDDVFSSDSLVTGTVVWVRFSSPHCLGVVPLLWCVSVLDGELSP
jgi:hypothetical protein